MAIRGKAKLGVGYCSQQTWLYVTSLTTYIDEPTSCHVLWHEFRADSLSFAWNLFLCKNYLCDHESWAVIYVSGRVRIPTSYCRVMFASHTWPIPRDGHVYAHCCRSPLSSISCCKAHPRLTLLSSRCVRFVTCDAEGGGLRAAHRRRQDVDVCTLQLHWAGQF